MLYLNICYSLLIIVPISLWPLTSHAVLEDIQIGLSQPDELPLRWDNVTEPPIWVDGEAPVANSNWGVHQVELEPYEFVTVWLAEGQWLRIRHPEKYFLANALKIAVSSGTGLYADVRAYPAEDGKSLLLTPDLSSPRLVRITLAPQQDEAVAIALFTSRHEQPAEIAPQYQEIPLATDSVNLQFAYQTVPGSDVPITEMAFWYLCKHSPVTLKVQGPTQLNLESRFIYPPTETVLQQAYRVFIRMDDHKTRLLEFETTVDNQHPIHIQGKPVVLGRSEMIYLKIPEGEHELQISSSANLYARLISKAREERIEYLVPEAKLLQSDVKAGRENALPQRLDQFEDTFWSLEADTQANLKASGPAQLRLESRFIHPATGSVWQSQAYRLFVRLNNNKAQVVDFETTPNYQQSRVVNGQPLVLDLPKVTYLTLPDGEHDLQLSSDTHLYVRLMSISHREIAHPGYLFPELNRPPSPEMNAILNNAIVENPVPEWLNQSAWQFTKDELRTLYLTHVDTLEAVRHIALRFIRDNSRREGGLLGAMTMFEAARRRPYEARIRGLAKGLLGRHSFYRNLLPWHKQHNDSQTFHKFIAYQLRDPTSRNQPLVVAEQHQDAYLKRVAGAYFAPIHPSALAPQIYKLPRRTVPSLLRVIVKQQSSPQTHTLFVQFDDETPMRLQLEPYVFEVPSHYYRYAQGEAGLKMLALAHGTDADTLGGPFASRYGLGSLIDASTLVLPLPPDVRQIKVWQSPSAQASSAAFTEIEPLHVALQYRAARRHYRLSETEYLEAFSHFDSSAALFDYLVAVLRAYKGEEATIPPAKNDAERDLYNYWLPFIRFLQAQKKHFIAMVYRSGQEKPHRLLNQIELNRLVAQARRAQADKQWLVALETWTEVARSSQGRLHRQAQLAREKSLEQLGEVFLAKRLLQGLFLDSTDPVLAQKAFDKLFNDYQQWDEKPAQLPLLATRVLRNPTPALFKQLTQVLIENGYYEYAVMVGMALPPAQRPDTLMVEQAYHLGWWQIFDLLLQQLPAEKQQLWLGYRAQDKGDYATAMTVWGDAGTEGRQLAKALEDGLQIREQLQSQHTSPQNREFRGEVQREKAIDDWARWQADHPGPRHWKTADNLVHDYVSAELTYSIERDLYFYSFIGTPQRPVKLQIPGPRRIRLSVRTLHHKDDIQPLDGWVKIKAQNQLHVLRLNNILPSRGLHIVGAADKRLGHRTIEEYEFGPGLHEVEIFADDMPIAIKVQAEMPRLPLAVLPPLTADTLAVALMLQDDNLTDTSACHFAASSYPDRGERATPSVEPDYFPETDTIAKSDSIRKYPQTDAIAPSDSIRKYHTDTIAKSDSIRKYAQTDTIAKSDSIRKYPQTDAIAKSDSIRKYAQTDTIAKSDSIRKYAQTDTIAPSDSIRKYAQTDAIAPSDSIGFTKCRRAVSLPDCQCTDCAMLIPHCVTFTSYNQYVKREPSYILEYLRRWQATGNTPLNPLSREDLYRDAKIAQYLAAENYAAVLAAPFKNEDSDILKRMTLLLWIAEHSPTLARKAFVEGAVLFNKHPQIAKLRPLWSALRANYHWGNLQSIESSAGLQFIEIRGWQPESPSQRIRKTLLKPVSEHEQIITGHRQMGLSMFNLAKTTLELKLRMDDVAYFRPVPMNVVYWLDEQPHQRLRLTAGQPNQTRRLTVPKGEHILYVTIDKPVANQFLRLQVKETGRGNAPLFLEYERTYHISTPEEPVVVNVQGPNWLRIDEWYQDAIYSRYQKVKKGWQTLTFAPRKRQSSALLRVHEMVPVTEQTPEVQLRYFSVAPEVMPDPVVQIYKLPSISRLEVKDTFPLGEQEEGTWSFTGLVRRRRNVEEDETGFQDFLELRATHRYFDEIKNRYHRTEGLIRFNDHFDITLGARKRVRYRPKAYDFTAILSGAAYLQQFRDGGNPEWHGLLKGTVLQRWALTDKTFHVPSVSLFGRILSRDESPDDHAARLDNDVYSNYKAEHRFGITIADKITHRPWLDTLWTGRAALTSNENFFDPDYLSMKAEWKQMLGEGQVDVGYRVTHYWADEDRNNSSNRHFLTFDLNWNRWQQNQTRWELGAKLQQDLDNDELFGMLYISWHGGKGRAYRDFMPGEIDFLNLRKRRIPQEENNEIMRFW